MLENTTIYLSRKFAVLRFLLYYYLLVLFFFNYLFCGLLSLKENENGKLVDIKTPPSDIVGNWKFTPPSDVTGGKHCSDH